MNATQLALHKSRCRDQFCDYCETAAERHQADRDEPLTHAEESARATQWERSIGL